MRHFDGMRLKLAEKASLNMAHFFVMLGEKVIWNISREWRKKCRRHPFEE